MTEPRELTILRKLQEEILRQLLLEFALTQREETLELIKRM